MGRAGQSWPCGSPIRNCPRSLRQFAPVGKAQQNVAHHYDLSGELYDLFLDADRQYSCAYFERDVMSLDAAQLAKKRHIALKLQIEPGMKVLDIGCGWGGMGLTLARDYGAEVVGVTLSKEQHAIAIQRARDEGLEGQVDFRLCDYRTVTEKFANEADSWMVKYIFPGGYAPALSEIQKAVDKQWLVPTDIEVLRLHYAKTLGLWYDRFMTRIDEARALYDDRFVRMWRYYLLSMEASFSVGTLLVYQLQFGKSLSAAPMTRRYLYEDVAERVKTQRAEGQAQAAE
ncbi:MAG: cyclopropane-fatty-acyl-phospholipid synthase [Maritimibacter sp.]